jgi:hypothetical protein
MRGLGKAGEDADGSSVKTKGRPLVKPSRQMGNMDRFHVNSRGLLRFERVGD